MKSTDLISIHDLGKDEVRQILDLAVQVKKNPGYKSDALKGRTLAMIFEKPSLRTRVSFEAGMTQLGGHAIAIQGSEESRSASARRWGDVSPRTLSGMVNGNHGAHLLAPVADSILAQHASVPVINRPVGFICTPCQALADFMTVGERLGKIAGLKLAYVGDGNNVAHH